MSSRPPIEDFELRTPDDMDVEHCYRHRDRETGVHCANCGRPICHECMTPAAVGFRCPECMAEQRSTTTRARVVTRQQTRGRWQSGALGRGGMSATKVLIAINIAVYVLQNLGGIGNQIDNRGVLVPYLVVHHEYWRMLTSMFLHASIWHVGVNMLSLWFLGEFTEQIVGRAKFLVLYFVGGLAGSVFVVLFSAPFTPTLGASGAIAAVFGGLMAYAFLNRHRDSVARAIFGQLVFWFILNLILNLSNSALSWQGHLGGFVGGIVLVAAFTLLGRKSPSGRFTGSDLAWTVGVLVLLVALTYWRVQTFPLAALLPWL